MSEITEQEAREAATRCLNAGDDSWVTSRDYYTSPKYEEDNDIVSRFVLQELARRDAERAEREKPIDAEWLESIGWERRVTAMGNTYRADGNFHEFGGVVFLCGCELKNVKSRVQLLDLLRALKGGA